MRRSMCPGPIAAAVVLAALCGALLTTSRGSDDQDLEERQAAGRRAFQENCLMCHAEEMTTRLRLTERQWSAELDKMIGWGAPVPPYQKDLLLDYLVSRFSNPVTAPVPAPERITLRAAESLHCPEGLPAIAGDPARGAPLYAAHCATCHGPEARGGDLGTCLVEKRVLLRPTEYNQIVWKGLRRMPGFQTSLKPEQSADIRAWLRTRRFEAPAP